MELEEKNEKRSSISIPGDSAKKLKAIGDYRRGNKIFDWTQPKVLIELIDKEFKRITK